MRTLRSVCYALCLALPGLTEPTFAQDAESGQEMPALVDDEKTGALARSLRRWATALEGGHIRVTDLQSPDLAHSQIYRPAYQAGLVRRFVDTPHLDLLRALLLRAETRLTPEVRSSVLALASLGYDRRAFDHQLVQARELAHWTLMRCVDDAVWTWLREIASARAPRDSHAATLRTAALALIGQRNDAVDRALVEHALTERDARIRLGAAEALQRMKRAESLDPLLGAFESERHAVVAQGLIDATHAVLRQHATALDRARLDWYFERLLAKMPRRDWRTQLAIVHVLRRFPRRAAVPELIAVLERHRPAELRRSSNPRVSPVLQHAAWESLCALTGTRLPIDEPRQWREFWDREGESLQIIGSEAPRTAQRTTARATFYGTPVIGRNVAFLIDTSGSMGKLVRDPDDPHGGKRSRVRVAAWQVARAISGLPRGTRYRLLTFADEVHDWSPGGVTVARRSQRALTSQLEDFRSNGGGTNLWAALRAVLGENGAGIGARGDGVEEIFVVTDGLPSNCEVTEPEVLLKLVRELNRYQKVRINAVFAGTGAGEELLRQLVDETGGEMVGW